MNDKTKANTKSKVLDEDALENVQAGTGNHLLGHELTHVSQEKKGVSTGMSGNPEGVTSGQNDGLKRGT